MLPCTCSMQALLQDICTRRNRLCSLYGTHCTSFKSNLLRYCELWCDPKNAVALHCAQCSVYLCRECDQRMHQGRRMSHTRSEPSSRKQSPLHGGQTPVHGGQTLVHGGRTPVHGGQTPVHGGQTLVHGGRTPVHGGRTPVHGGQTPVHGGPTLEPPQVRQHPK